jgi:hypothetical protein
MSRLSSWVQAQVGCATGVKHQNLGPRYKIQTSQMLPEIDIVPPLFRMNPMVPHCTTTPCLRNQCTVLSFLPTPHSVRHLLHALPIKCWHISFQKTICVCVCAGHDNNVFDMGLPANQISWHPSDIHRCRLVIGNKERCPSVKTV